MASAYRSSRLPVAFITLSPAVDVGAAICQCAQRSARSNSRTSTTSDDDGCCRDSACDYAPISCEPVPVGRIEQVRCCSLIKVEKEAAFVSIVRRVQGGVCFEEDHNPRFSLALLNNICASTRRQLRSRVLWRRPSHVQPWRYLHWRIGFVSQRRTLCEREHWKSVRHASVVRIENKAPASNCGVRGELSSLTG